MYAVWLRDDRGAKVFLMDLFQEVLDVTATGQFHKSLNFSVDWMVDLNILDAASIIDNR